MIHGTGPGLNLGPLDLQSDMIPIPYTAQLSGGLSMHSFIGAMPRENLSLGFVIVKSDSL